jgi:hypothetical protein
VHLSGIPAYASIGLTDGSDNIYAGTQPTVRISRQGVIHFESKDCKAHPLLFTKKNGTSLAYQGQICYRQILITVDSQHFDSAPIKNDLQWDSDTNKAIIRQVGQDPGFRAMLDKIRDYNNTKAVSEEKVVSRSYKQKLDKLEIAAAAEFNKTLADSSITDFDYPLKQSNGSAPQKQKRRGTTTKASKKKKDTKKQPTVKIDGKSYKFKIEWIKKAAGQEHMRSWLEKTDDAFIVNVNQTYAGYTNKIRDDEKKEAVYLADTIGQSWGDYRFESLASSGKVITVDLINDIQRTRDDAIARYMPIIIG